jgi:spore germination protein YaaH
MMPKITYKKELKTISNNEKVSGQNKQSWFQKNKTKLKIIVMVVVLFVATASLSLWLNWEIPLVSPIDAGSKFSFLSNPNYRSQDNKIIYGFLPYWNINTVTLQDELTHLGYFSLTIDAKGNFIESTNGEVDMGLRRLNTDEFLDIGNSLIENDKQVEIVITQFNHGDIVAFLGSKSAQEKFFRNLDSVLLAYPINGVNIDFETSGKTDQKLRDHMTEFMKDLRTHLDSRYADMQISIDVYASAAKNPQLWDIAAITPYVDYIVVMAYDFHRSSSPRAGPIAPLFGGKDLWDGDINQYLQAFLAIVPNEKILLGIPFYGYGWQTTSSDPQSHTFPNTGGTFSYNRVSKLIEERGQVLGVEEYWSEEALSPYIVYKEDGQTYIVYYENSRSISYKLDYVNQLNLGGVAIWALGYEGDSRDLWDVVSRKMNLSTTNHNNSQ